MLTKEELKEMMEQNSLLSEETKQNITELMSGYIDGLITKSIGTGETTVSFSVHSLFSFTSKTFFSNVKSEDLKKIVSKQLLDVCFNEVLKAYSDEGYKISYSLRNSLRSMNAPIFTIDFTHFFEETNLDEEETNLDEEETSSLKENLSTPNNVLQVTEEEFNALNDAFQKSGLTPEALAGIISNLMQKK